MNNTNTMTVYTATFTTQRGEQRVMNLSAHLKHQLVYFR